MEITNLKGEHDEALPSSSDDQFTQKSAPVQSASFPLQRRRAAFDSSLSQYRLTDIVQGKTNPDRVNIYLDGHFVFSLSLAQLAEYKLKVGNLITAEDLKRYQKASTFGKLYQHAILWIAARPRSIMEVRTFLKRKQHQKNTTEITDEDLELIIKKLCEKKYLDDLNYTRYYIEHRFTKKGISTYRLKSELHRKGISDSMIEDALNTCQHDDVSEIQKIIMRKRRVSAYRINSDTPEEERILKNRKLVQYLVRQGFSFDLAKTTIEETDKNDIMEE